MLDTMAYLGSQEALLSVLHSPAEGAVCHLEKPQSPTYLSIVFRGVDRCLNFSVKLFPTEASRDANKNDGENEKVNHFSFERRGQTYLNLKSHNHVFLWIH